MELGTDLSRTNTYIVPSHYMVKYFVIKIMSMVSLGLKNFKKNEDNYKKTPMRQLT